MGVNYAKLERDNGAGEDLQAGLNPVMREEFALSGYDDDCKTQKSKSKDQKRFQASMWYNGEMILVRCDSGPAVTLS